jgi:hypothetical protein
MINAVNYIRPAMPLMQAVGATPNPYSEGARTMAREASPETVSWDLFKWIVGPLLAIIVGGLGFYLNGIRDDISGLRKDLVDTKVDIVRSVSGVENQISATNGKLDILIAETRQRR